MIGPDICDLTRIYSPEYSYSMPKKLLESFLSGNSFDYKTPYTDTEAQDVNADINEIWQNIMEKGPVKERVAVITAGGPGAGKTMLMEQDLKKQESAFGYIDPDAVCLKSQTRTYLQEKRSTKDEGIAAYTKWRPASNAACHIILANLIREKFGIYFGTTATGDQTWRFFSHLKEQGYAIRLIHVTAPDQVRWDSICERDKTFVQTTEEDTREKGKLLPQRISDTYLKYADTIEFYYRDGVHEDAQLAATWSNRKVEVVDPTLYEKIKAIHNAAVGPELAWENTVERD